MKYKKYTHTTTPLGRWMLANGYNHRTLAAELGYGYHMIYKIAVRGDRGMSDAFKYKFVARFGWGEAAKVFDVAPAVLPTSDLAPAIPA